MSPLKPQVTYEDFAKLDLRIGNGYTEGHAELTLDLLRESPELRRHFSQSFS